MSRSGRDARTPPQEITAADGRSPAPRARTLEFEHRLAMRLVRLAVIVIRAVRQINQQNRASAMARLAAWDKRQVHRLEVKAQQQVRAAKGTRRMIRSRPSKDLSQKMRQT